MDNKGYYPLNDIENILPILNKIAILGGLNNSQLYKIFKLVKRTQYDRGEYVYKAGDAPSHIYIVESGEVKVVVENSQVSLEMWTLKVGDCFGETSVIGIQSHTSSVIAVEKTELIVLEKKSLLNIFDTDKELFGLLILNIARETSRRLLKLDKIILNYILHEKN